MAARQVATTLPERLRAARRDVDDATTALKLAIRVRNRLVVEAIDDEGLSQREVGRLAGITSPRVNAILAGSHDEEDDQ